jgi:hypothetical protein
LAGSLVCLCESGYRGDYCEVAFDNCDPDPCLNGGICFDGDDTSYCDCPEGYEGATCERPHDECLERPCLNGGICVASGNERTCSCPPGFAGEDCEGGLLPSCRAILDLSPAAANGVYAVDPDGPGVGNPPLEVFCDMATDGWTLVAQEQAGTAGALKFLGISVGDAAALARDPGHNGLIGERFRGAYEEVSINWSNEGEAGDDIYFRVTEEIFENEVNRAIPISDFYTTNPALGGWVNAAGGAVLCRASQSPSVRPGDTSWAIKPKNDTETQCGCNSPSWTGRGAFYGGFTNPTLCNPSGGGWAGIADNGATKGGITRWSVQIWIR